ncbi:MAG: CPBP family intramembrane metalloprotease [Lachnospiraceae bacterium]|nr:CPBP family intramembrane metalloprotease [Lachnospiraceae bacterium]
MTKFKSILISILAMFVLILSQSSAILLASLFMDLGVPKSIGYALAGIFYIAFTFFFLYILCYKIFKLDFEYFGITKFKLKIKWLIVAFLLPIAVKGFFLLFIDGSYISNDLSNEKTIEVLLNGIFFVGLAAGFVEEMIFRGVVFRSLDKAWGRKIAVIVPSFLFGVVHIMGNFSGLSCILTVLAGTCVGIMFSMITIEAASVWSNAIVHTIWNIVIIGGGLFIAGKANDQAIMSYVIKSKSVALTGGDFGIESSVIGLVAYIVVALIAYFMIKKNDKADA